MSHPRLELSSAQRDALLRLLTEPQPLTKSVHTSFPNDHGFVFTDEHDVPVGQVAFSMHLARVAAEPSLLEPGDWNQHRFQRLRELVFELSPMEAIRRELEPQLVEQWHLDRAAFSDSFNDPWLARYLASRSGIDGGVRQDALTGEQQAVACAWQALTWRQGNPASGRDRHGIECEDGVPRRGVELSRCQSDFPRCPVPLGKVEDCMRLQRFDPCLDSPAAQRCRPLRDCFWGMRVASAPEQRALGAE